MSSTNSKQVALVYSTAYFPFVGGAEIAIREIARNLSEYEWHLATARIDRALLKQEIIDGVVVHRFGFGLGALDKFLLPFAALPFALRLSRRADFAFAWSMMASQASVGAALLKFFRPRTHLVLTIQEGDEETYLKRYVGGSDVLYKLFVRPWYRAVFHAADAVTAISRYLKARAEESGAEVPVDLVPNGVDLEKFRPVPPPKLGETIRLVTASRLVEKNGVGDVIEALPMLPHNIEFSILGAGHLEAQLRRRVSELGLDTRVHFLGAFTQDQEAELFRESDIFIRPALSEGLGIAYLNAMAVGLPTIGTPVGGIPDFLVDGETGIFCEPQNPASVAVAIRRLIENPDLLVRVANGGRELIRSSYGWAVLARAMDAAFSRRGSCRVLQAAGIFPPEPGGPGLHAAEYQKRFHAEGSVVRTILFRTFKHLPKVVRHVAYLHRLLISGRSSDVIFAHDAVSSGFPAAVAAAVLGRRLVMRIGGDVAWERAAETGATVRSMNEWYQTGDHRNSKLFKISRFSLRRAARIIVSSPILRDLYVSRYGIGAEKIEIIGSPIVGQEVPAGNPAQGFFASRLVKYKNLEFVLDVLASLPQENPVRLVVAGDGPELMALKAQAFDLGIKDRVEFLGRVSEDRVLGLTEESGFAIAPALTEFNPNYLLRAVGGGKPFLVSHENGLPFPVPHELQFDARNPDELRERLSWIASTEGAAQARELVRSIPRESWESVFQQVRSIVCAS